MSVWGKFLPSVTVPTGGYTWAASDAGGRFSTTLAAGAHNTMLHMAGALSTGLNADGGSAFLVTINGVGGLTVSSSSAWTTVWGNTTAAFYADLGFDGDEEVASNLLTATDPHDYGYYPGTITYGATQGSGLSDDSGWVPEETEETAKSGSGQARTIRPDRDIHRRVLQIDTIKRVEREHPKRGVAMLERYARDKKVYWYPDRADGTTGVYGTQGDPEDDPRDSSADYWLCTFNDRPNVQRGQSHPDHFIASFDFNGEPD